ncbi:MAG: glycosyltransferase [Chloroflexota bacterium]|nr:glycosyltransferase [Chloroflexota bacterium]
MLSKAVVVGVYQRKLEELARLPEIQLTVIVPPAWRDSRGETRLERAYIEGYTLVETPIALNGHFHAHFYPQLGQALHEARPDLVHVDEEPYNLATWQAIRWAAKHERPALFFTWQNLIRQYPPPFKWIENFNYRHAAAAIAGNREAELVLRSKGFRQPVTVIPQFGVDPELFDTSGISPLWERPTDARLVVGYAGGLLPEKGVDLLLSAIQQCNATLGGTDCYLLLAGTGTHEDTLTGQSIDLGLIDQVAFLGRISSTRMPAFYQSIDVLVLPSRTMPNWKEQFGRVLIEAMACSVPVIGSDSGEIPNVIGDAQWVFAEEDTDALAEKLVRLAQNPRLRLEVGQQGRQRVLDHFTQEKIALATADIYRRVLNETSDRSE